MNEIIKKFELKCEEWTHNCEFKESKIVFNTRLKLQKKDKIKYIVVGDNPGKDEAANGEYLVGDAGIVTRLFFENFLVNNFDDEILVLNKTPISSLTTELLMNEKDECLKETQRFMADIIMELHKNLDVPVIILGFSGCRETSKHSVKWLDSTTVNKKAIGKYFFSKLKENYKNSPFLENLFVVKHFSRNCFFDDFNIKNYRRKDIFEIFRIGSEYRKEIFK